MVLKALLSLSPVALAAVVLGALAVALLGALVLKAVRTRKAPDYVSEDYFKRPEGGMGRFPTLADAPTVTVSIVVPAYKEEKRIHPMMTAMLAQVTKMSVADPSFTWEILVVNDGSPDNTSKVVYDTYVKQYGTERFRLLDLYKNNGKGGAVRKGMVRARGQYLLMADADGATAESELEHVLAEIKKVEKDGLGIAIGSRAHLNDAAADGAAGAAQRTPLRRFLMWGFHTYIGIMIGSSKIRDTQCGFKLFTRKAAAKLFPVQHIDRWAFDVELVFLAAQHGIPMVEVPVAWQEVDGSKVDLMSDTIQMARDIFTIRMSYMLGVWNKNGEAQPAPLATPGFVVPTATAEAAPAKKAAAAAAPAPAAAGAAVDGLDEDGMQQVEEVDEPEAAAAKKTVRQRKTRSHA